MEEEFNKWIEGTKVKVILDTKVRGLIESFEKQESFEYMDWSSRK